VARRGTWNVLDGHWTFADGTTADGTTVTLPQKHLGGSVTITDGARQDGDDRRARQVMVCATRPAARTATGRVAQTQLARENA
jgi:hypothetical protein